MKCLIVAAGQGARLREKLDIKPLVPIHGAPLIKHVIDRAYAAGVREFLVVNGYRGDELRQGLDAMLAGTGLHLTHIDNADWHRANGISVLKAAPYLDEPFLLTMADHIVDPDILRQLMRAPCETESVTLAVDFNIETTLADLDDVTRVTCVEGRITRIGKLIADFNCFDTGVFMATPAMFDALSESMSSGDDSISGAMTMLARRGKACGLDIGDKLWIDVDDAGAFDKAEALLASGQL